MQVQELTSGLVTETLVKLPTPHLWVPGLDTWLHSWLQLPERQILGGSTDGSSTQFLPPTRETGIEFTAANFSSQPRLE